MKLPTADTSVRLLVLLFVALAAAATVVVLRRRKRQRASAVLATRLTPDAKTERRLVFTANPT